MLKTFTLFALSSACALSTAATLTGPSYPPPGNVSFVSSGAGSGIGAGKTFSYSNFDPSAYGVLYWGPTSVQIGYSTSPLGDMTFAGCTGLSCEFDDNTDWIRPTRMLLTLSGNIGSEQTESSLGVNTAPTYPLFLVSGNFSATFVFQANNGGWQPIDQISNESLGTFVGNPTNDKSVNFGFFSSSPTPEPGYSALIGLGLLGFGWTRKRRV